MKIFRNEKGESEFPWGWLLMIFIFTGGLGMCGDDDDETKVADTTTEQVSKVDKATDKIHEAVDKAKEAYEKTKEEGDELMSEWFKGKDSENKEEADPKPDSEIIPEKPSEEETKKDAEYL